tara:strand:+ start:1503 stop:1856 length:354 start_codon:yes stop_codon:yes gene_type:complete
MKPMLKINLIASDALTTAYGYLNIAEVTSVDVNADTVVIKSGASTLTATIDGTDAAEKLLNGNKLAAYLMTVMKKGYKDGAIIDAWDTALTIAGVHTLTGMVRTGADNTAIVSIVIA